MVRHNSVQRCYRLTIFVTVASAFCLGCGSGLGIVPASGVVMYEGTTMTGGKVLMTPLKLGKSAIGPIQSDGSFQLRTLKPGDGAVPGEYRATVVADVQREGKEVHLTCMAPQGLSFTVDKGAENHFKINVSEAEGWKTIADD